MTQTLESLARKTASLASIRGIVHTMKTVSVINSAPYEQAAEAIEAFHATVLEGLQAFLYSHGPLQLSPDPPARQVMIVFGSDHGLCGNYNEALAEDVLRYLGPDPGAAWTLLCVGAQMADALAEQGIAVEQTHLTPASADGIVRLANLLAQELDGIRRDSLPRPLSASIAHCERRPDGLGGSAIRKLLPIDPALIAALQDRGWRSRSLPVPAGPPEMLLGELLRGHLFASLFRASAEALVTENAARMARMQQAERAVDDRLEDVTAETRNLRQSEITAELLDLIAGFEALRKPRRPNRSVREAPG
ncbi:F0F1 ATP synthase subunit gamma [Tropicimonas sp. TH_r6]|uniref:F0F1 ATP synthase subunit gamma n=1 Tax=Tropicimonas sp. TH_r6 TaxID=3082085 RepID=UPI002954865F|nr:F0F1 ATP synthase subunit gamma [Tropicimonas sp. TH_r6]MDV7143256.1 F0F1 ATP synthase subunit gamma [Tropicimonas sp. TH_r6]